MSDILYYGKLNGKIVSIEDVEKGLNCNCLCPSCGGILIAKKGNKNIHHFAHQSNQSCEYGYETTLHLLAKDIISKSNSIFIPSVTIKHNKKYTQTIEEERNINIDNVQIENLIDDIKPDLLITTHGQKYIIEIYVTHKVDEQKYEKLKQHKIPTIEINLSKFRHHIETDTLKEILLNEHKNKYWIFNEVIQSYYDTEHIKKIEKEKEINLKIDKYGVKVEDFIPQNCPIGNTYAINCWNQNVIKEYRKCNKCPYCDGMLNGYSICTIKNKSFTAHLNIDQKCPICNVPLKLQMGAVNAYLKCPNYNTCKQISYISCPLCENQLKIIKCNEHTKIECYNCSFSEIINLDD